MKMKKTMKFSHHLNNNKEIIVISVLFVLGLYHMLMSLLKLNVLNLNSDQITLIKPFLYKAYHISYNLLIGLGFVFVWSKKMNWIWLYVGFKITYNLLLLIPDIKDIFSSSLVDGLGFGLLIVVILILLRSEKSS